MHSHFFHSPTNTQTSDCLFSIENMLGKQILTKMLMCKMQAPAAAVCNHRVRWMVGKASNGAAVHGSKLPVPDVIPMDEAEMEMKKSIEEKERKRREIENSVDSQLKNWQVLYVEQIVRSK